jgi:hypothetical protein
MMHSVLRGVQQGVYGRKIARTNLRESPLFIIGHWRTGTTLLHELLALDERHSYPTTYACMEPNHFLLTETLFTKWLPFFAPNRRPMDNMAAGFGHPQEEEFALCMLGQPSPYLSIAFPNADRQFEQYLDLEGLPPAAVEAWKRAFLGFLKELTFKDDRKLILKSPTHSCRIKVLLEMFPDAQFVHIVRDPHAVFPSTVNLWKALEYNHGLQQPTYERLEEHVLNTFVRVYEKIEEGKKQIPPERFFEMRYEDLTRNPVAQMDALYDHLNLGGFDQVLPALQEHLSRLGDYQTNRYGQVAPEVRAKIVQRWGHVIRQYGYDSPAAKPARPAAAPRSTAAEAVTASRSAVQP